MTWQPIETAPRDGTLVDLWHKDGFRVTDTWWDDTDPEEAIWVCLFPNDEFTHWQLVTYPEDQPLHPPPED